MSNEIIDSSVKLAKAAGRKLTVIGGGTGLSTLLLGLKEYTDNITAIVTVTDDGGGSGTLRREYGVLPPGDVRNCILALANTGSVMETVLNHRFSSGSLAGQNFGNLFLFALNEIYGSFDAAVANMSNILAVTGKVLPVTKENISLCALFNDGAKVTGETSITDAKKRTKANIKRISLQPENPKPLPQVIEAIENADVIILGPGSLYTSIIPNLLVDGVANVINRSKALKLYVLNIMTQDGETENYTALDHVNAIISHAGRDIMHACIYNTRLANKKLLERYALEGSEPIYPAEEEFAKLGIKLFGHDMLSRSGKLARHDPLRLAYCIMDACRTLAPRKGKLMEYDDLLLSI